MPVLNCNSSRRGHAVVIGSGFAGLAVAIRLLALGFKVIVLERNEFLGGRARNITKEGFSFDAGPTVITGVPLIEELYELAGERMESHISLVELDPYYRVFESTEKYFDFYRDKNRFIQEVSRTSPADVKGANRFLNRVEKIFETFYPYTLTAMSKFRVMLTMLPFLFIHRAIESVTRLSNRYFRDSFLRSVFQFHPLLVGGNPNKTPSLYSLIDEFERKWGVFYSIGGTSKIIDSLSNMVIKLGGDIRKKSEVREIKVSHGRACGVILANGEMINAEIVVSNADPQTTYRKLLKSHGVSSGLSKLRWKLQHPSMSLYVFYFGLDTQLRPTKLVHHSILLGQDSKEAITAIFSRKHHELNAPRFFYIHLPTLTDATISPDGCDSLYVLVGVPPTSPGESRDPKEFNSVRTEVLNKLEEYLPGFKDHIRVEHHINPGYFEETLASPSGAAFSSQPTLLQSAWFRAHNKSKRIKNLYLVGAGTHPGAGVPAVLASAKIVANLIADDITGPVSVNLD